MIIPQFDVTICEDAVHTRNSSIKNLIDFQQKGKNKVMNALQTDNLGENQSRMKSVFVLPLEGLFLLVAYIVVDCCSVGVGGSLECGND